VKNILTLMNSFSVGGVTNVVFSFYNAIDKSEYKIDFIRDGIYEENNIEKNLKENGCKVYTFTKPKIGKIPFLNYKIQHRKIAKELLKKIGDKKYDAIHVHAYASVGIILAKALKIPVRILHFHEAVTDFRNNANKSIITKIIWKNRQKEYNKWATVKAGDSLKACKVKYGEKVEFDNKLCIIYPPIDMQKFNPKNYSKQNAITNFSINEDNLNIIHVGRLCSIKNQKFIIEVIKELNQIKCTSLYLVGDGKRKQQLIDYANELGVLDKITFLPPNVSAEIYLAMDCSILPSFSEAFGMVAVESQLMGVRCFASTGVPKDVDIGACEFLDLSLGAKAWANAIINSKPVSISQDKKSLFDIKEIIKRVQDLYQGKI